MRKKTNAYSHQRGQSLVLVALAAIALIAFVGLAIDGGNAFAHRRIAQNAADGASVRGALSLVGTWRTLAPTSRRDLMQERINETAELHGVPDTDGSPGNTVNDNVVGFYTDDEGAVFTDCPVATCTDMDILSNSWGVRVVITIPVDTYFAGVIGWNEMNVSSEGTAIAQPGARASDGSRWSMFALSSQGCNSSGNPAVNFQGINNLYGNAHSNATFSMGGGASYATGTGQVTYVTNCVGCPSGAEPTQSTGLVLPSFNAYYDFANTHTQSPYTGLRIEGDYTWPGTTGQTTLGSVNMPATTPAPVTFINGNLTIQSDATTQYRLAGLIVVNGNVLIDIPRIRSQESNGTNGGLSMGATIMATGTIQVTARTQLVMQGYYDKRTTPYNQLLAQFVQVAALYSNRDYTQGGGDVCVDPAIDIRATNYAINGAVLAPNGRINVFNDATTGTRQIAGTIIGDAINVGGRNISVSFRPEWFPPQPDQVELRE
jgi:Flp pilus assembly protein TadG